MVLPHILAKPQGYWLYLEPNRSPFPTSLDQSPFLPLWLLCTQYHPRCHKGHCLCPLLCHSCVNSECICFCSPDLSGCTALGYATPILTTWGLLSSPLQLGLSSAMGPSWPPKCPSAVWLQFLSMSLSVHMLLWVGHFSQVPHCWVRCLSSLRRHEHTSISSQRKRQ